MKNKKYSRFYMKNFLENLMTYYQNKISCVNDQSHIKEIVPFWHIQKKGTTCQNMIESFS
jgi:hypothetical protein